MVSTGLDFGNETSDGPKIMGALTWNPAPGWTVDLYADYENLTGPTGFSNPAQRVTTSPACRSIRPSRRPSSSPVSSFG